MLSSLTIRFASLHPSGSDDDIKVISVPLEDVARIVSDYLIDTRIGMSDYRYVLSGLELIHRI